ncbi:hypothetical protein E3N88_11497 [Mikania micrantha]|uniref:Uncharacterized protein n=1 Tax=Mikania micrantha TaxID=192012 RepID=A0A5N6PGP0_9ASTR|nr:hypothetical protein E3N88_11497 [Mikania micrantha]
MGIETLTALREPALPALTEKSTAEAKLLYEKWEKANRMALMFIKNSISPILRGAIPDLANAKAYLTAVEEQFKGTSKAHASTLITKLVSTKYDGISGIREHIMMMNDMARKLKGLDMEISDGFVVHFIMTSLPASYEAFKINYNTQKEKWMMNELIAMCVQEEERQKLEKPDVAYLMATGSKKRKNNTHKDASKVPKSNACASSSSNNSNGKPYCKFCRKVGHKHKDCPDFKEWLAKRGNHLNMIIESFNLNVPTNTWWFDSGSMVHVTNSTQGFLTIRRLERNQRTLKLGDRKELFVAAVGTLELILKTGLCIKLYDTLYIPEISRNLVSGPKLDMDGFYVSHSNGKLTISSNSQVFGTGLLDGGLYKLELDDDFSRSLLSYNINENSTKTKRKRDLETSSMLWHQRLSHISRDRLSRLVKDEVLPSFDFTDFGTCVKCLIDGLVKGSSRYAMLEKYLRFSGFLCAMANQGERYIYQRFPYVVLDDTPSSSSGSDSDPAEASSAASQATPAVPHTPSAPRPVTPPPPPSPLPPPPAQSASHGHSQPRAEDIAAEGRHNPSPQRVPAWDGLRRMRWQARKTTGLPPRHPLAPITQRVINSIVLPTSLELWKQSMLISLRIQRHSSTNLPSFTPLVHHATPNFTAPTPTQSGLTTAPNVTENEGTSSDQHQSNTSHAEPANQLRRHYHRLDSVATAHSAPDNHTSRQQQKRQGRTWRIRLNPRLKLKFPRSPRKVFIRLRDAYVRIMMKLANTSVVRGRTMTGYNGDGFGKTMVKEYEEKIIIEICKNLTIRQNHQHQISSRIACSG